MVIEMYFQLFSKGGVCVRYGVLVINIGAPLSWNASCMLYCLALSREGARGRVGWRVGWRAGLRAGIYFSFAVKRTWMVDGGSVGGALRRATSFTPLTFIRSVRRYAACKRSRRSLRRPPFVAVGTDISFFTLVVAIIGSALLMIASFFP